MTYPMAPSDRESASVWLLDQAMSFAYPAALRAAAIVGVADHLVDGPKTPAELARATNTDQERLYRVLRLLATRGVFREDDDGRFELTTAADLLRDNVPLSARKAIWMLTSKQHWLPAEELAECLRTGGPSFDAIFGTAIWNYRGGELPAEEEFNIGMALMSEVEMQSPVRCYEFPQGATVVDVGGGYGAVLLLVLKQNPTLRGVLFDQPHVLSGHRLGELGTEERWDLVSGDFFEKCPPGDIYLLKFITHDWDDESCVRILRNCREAMTSNGRVLVFETVIPRGNSHHTGKLMDMLVMGIYPGRERTTEEFRKLLREAGLRLNRIIDTDSHISIVEAVAA